MARIKNSAREKPSGIRRAYWLAIGTTAKAYWKAKGAVLRVAAKPGLALRNPPRFPKGKRGLFFRRPQTIRLINRMSAEERKRAIALSRGDKTERFHAIKGVSEYGNPGWVFFLEHALEDPEPIVRREAIFELRSHYDSGAWPRKMDQRKKENFFSRIGRMTRDPDAGVRREALFCLDAIDREMSVGFSKRMLDDSDPKIRVHAARLIVRDQAIEVISDLERHRNDPDPEVRREVRSALHILSDDIRHHTLYAGIKDSKFFESDRVPNAVFDKTGSEIILLGGEKAGAEAIRIIEGQAKEAWVKAFEAEDFWLGFEFEGKKVFDYVPIEPIIKGKKGQYLIGLTGKGHYSVRHRVLGMSLADFMRDPKAGYNAKARAARLARRIEEGLIQLGISHGHIHAGNFVVEMHEGKPRVYAIDFDQARH